MSKVELEAKVDALNDEINFLRTLYEEVRTSGLGDVLQPACPSQGAIWSTPCLWVSRGVCWVHVGELTLLFIFSGFRNPWWARSSVGAGAAHQGGMIICQEGGLGGAGRNQEDVEGSGL